MECFCYFKEKHRHKSQGKSVQSHPNLFDSSSTNLNYSSDNSNHITRTMKSAGPVATPLRCLSDLYEERVHNFRVFDYKDLKDATKNFYRALKLGEGGFGIVYKGILKGKDGNGDDGSMLVAVKRLKPNALLILGTNGYAAPDYIETGHLTTKSDVFSFGVVLYEILTGRRSLDRNRPKNEQKLLEWVKQYPVKTKQFRKIMDPQLEGRYELRAAHQIAKLADTCLAKQARDRPTMGQVVKALKKATSIRQDESQQQIEPSGKQKSV